MEGLLSTGPTPSSLSTFMKNAFDTTSSFFSQKNARNKNLKNDRNVFKLQRFSKVLPNVGGNPLFWRGINQKNYLNHELGSKFFS